MKDFRDKDLYRDEIGKFKTFLDEKLVTKSEYNRYDTGKKEEEEETFDVTTLAGYDSDLGGLSSSNDMFSFGDSFSDTFSQSNSKTQYTSWESEPKGRLFLKSPIFLSEYVFKDLLYSGEESTENNNKKFNFDLEHAKEFFKYVSYSGLFLFSTSILSKFVGFNTLHNPNLGLLVGMGALLGGEFFNWKVFNQGLISKYYPNPNPSSEKMEENDGGLSEGFEPDNSFGMGEFDFNEGESNFSFDSLSSEEASTPISLFSDDSDGLVIDDFEDEDYSDNSVNSQAGVTVLGDSSVDTSDEYLFKEGLKKEYMKNGRYLGKYLETRKEILDSFAGLMLNNDKSFSKWTVERERSVVYNNIAYTIYKALIEIEKGFHTNEEAKLNIISITYSPILYKIEIRLPQTFFTENKVNSKIAVFENYLKKDASDTEVQAMVSISGDIYTLRFLRLDYNAFISLGDILRYADDGDKGTAYQQMTNPKLNSPMLVGIRDNEYPHVIDLEANTAMAIVGGSGSGKSWLTYELITNLVTTNDFNEINFIALDFKNTYFWQTVARMPHVIGFHAPNPLLGYSADDFFRDVVKISAEVVEECYRRQGYLQEIEMEDAVEARKTFKKRKDYESLKKIPLLIFVVDEITSTMGGLKQLDKELYETFRNNLKIISQIGRSAGVRLLTIGQRAIDESLPKSVRINSTLLFGMKMAETEFDIFFGKSKVVEKMKKPESKGAGIVSSDEITGYHNLKALTPGGRDDAQIRTLLRVVAFDWIRRAHGRDDLSKPPYGADFKLSYNRPKFLEKSFEDMRKGRLFNNTDENPDVGIDLTGKNPVINRNTSVLPIIEHEEVSNNSLANTEIFGNENTLDIDSSMITDASVGGINLSEFMKPFDEDDGMEEFLDFDEDDIEEDDLDLNTPLSFSENLIPTEDIRLVDDNEDLIENFKEMELEEVEVDVEDVVVEEDEVEESKHEEEVVVEEEVEEELDASESNNDNEETLNFDDISIDDILYSSEDGVEESKHEEVNLEEISLKEELRRERERIILEDEEKTRLELVRKERESLELEREAFRKKVELEDKLRLEREKFEQEKREWEEAVRRQKEESIKRQKESIEKQTEKETVMETPSPQIVNISYTSTSNATNTKTEKLSLREFVFEKGIKISDFEFAIPKEDLSRVYTKAEIAKAIRLGDIVEAKDAYVSVL